MLYLLLFCFVNNVLSKHINLDEENTVILKGPISLDTSSKFITDLNTFNNKELNIFITSPGGSVLEGMKIIDHMKMLQNSGTITNCIVDFAASMAFVITQACDNRYSLSSGVLMQHQMSLSTGGPIENMYNYLKLINNINEDLDKMQAKKINMNEDKFKNKILNDWWLTANEAKLLNVIDDIVTVNCNKYLYKNSYKHKISNLFGDVEFTFSKCPLLREYLKIKFNKYIDDETRYKIKNEYLINQYNQLFRL
jgi:ATP-dependent protease ClpP protease subunit